jgi:hypothetical protein
MLRKLLLLSFVFGLSYCTLWVAGYSHIEQIEDDEHVGKTLLIYPSAGEFVLKEHWYFGKRSGDSYLSSHKAIRNSQTPPILYKTMGKYNEVYHGGSLLAGNGLVQYQVKQVKGESNKRLFFFSFSRCKEQTDLFDQETNIKIDFVCD